MGMRWVLLAGAALIRAGDAAALGPCASDWHDSAGGACIGAADAKAIYPGAAADLQAVAGRSRPDAGVVTTSGVWAVGTNGKIIYFNGVSWADHTITPGSPTTETLNDVYIYPTDVSVGGQWVAGWIVGDGGTVIRIVETSPGSGVFSYVCENCPAGSCGNGAGGPLNTCADLYDIFPADHNSAATGLFFTGWANCSGAPDNTAPTPFALGVPTLYYFESGMTSWREISNDSNGVVNACLYAPAPPSILFWHDMPGCSWGGGYTCAASGAMTGLITSNTGALATSGAIFDNGANRRHLGLTPGGYSWHDYGSSSSQDICGSRPRFMTSARVGLYAVLMGDTASCWSHNETDGGGPFAFPYNAFIYDPMAISSPMRAINTGLAASGTVWGSVRRMEFLQAWGFGIGVGATTNGTGADFAAVQAGTAVDSYFARIEAPDPNQLFAPQDPGSPNYITYEFEPGCVGAAWRGLNGVYIAAYNEAWAVGDTGRILHWTGPSVTPAVLDISLSQSPAGGLTPGAWVEIVMSVTNTGEAGLGGLATALFVSPPSALTMICGPTCSATACVSFPACPTGLPPGGPAFFTWTFSVNGCASNVVFTGTATGISLSDSVFKFAQTTLGTGAAGIAFTVSITHAPLVPTAGAGAIQYDIQVTNWSSTNIDNILVVDTLPAGLANPVAVTLPAGVTMTLIPTASATIIAFVGTNLVPPSLIGPAQSMFISFAADVPASCQTRTWTNQVVAIGDNLCGGSAQDASAPDSFSVAGPLDASLSLYAQQEISGRYLVDVVLTISNTGSSWARPILPAATVSLTPMTGDTVQVSGPSPTAYWGALSPLPPAGICTTANPCMTQITWQYRSAASQPTQFTAQATVEACPGGDGMPCSAGPLIGFSFSCTGCQAQGGASCVVSASGVTQFADSGEAGEFWVDRNLFRGPEKVVVSFQLKDAGVVTVRVYNGVGQVIRTLHDAYAPRRIQKDLIWNGTNDAGEKVASGAYFIKLEADRFVQTRKVARIK